MLSVVIPTYNESSDRFRLTLRALDAALEPAHWRDPEVVIVDDGSDQPVAVPALASARVRVLRQENCGRYEARRLGIEAAHGDYVLLLDSRVSLDPGSLAWVEKQVAGGAQAWNGHCIIDGLTSPYARFWDIIVNAAWSDYLRDPRTTSFSIDDYDRYPKGTGHFLAPRPWLIDALAEFDSLYSDSALASDDTHLLRSIAKRDRIHISPEFRSSYHSRESFGPFMRHTLRRGSTFFDGHSRGGSRFRPIALGTLPASLLGTVLACRRPRDAFAGVGLLGLAGMVFARRQGRSVSDAAWFGLLVPPFAVAYSAGMWRGAILAAVHRL